MAQLNSPGVAVTVIDESFYTPAAPGTTPLIVLATGQDKANGAGTGTAPGTLKANAGKVYLLTSQMELGSTFGTPFFETDASNNPVHGGERNEYGLQAAYSYLGVSSRAYVVRADVDLTALAPSTTAPAGAPVNGAYWFDTADSVFGIFEWNGTALTDTSPTGAQTFTNKIPTVISSTLQQVGGTSSGDPLASIGAIGSYALVVTASPYKLFFKNYTGVWVLVGSNAWTKSWPTAQGTIANPTFVAGDSITITATPTSTETIVATASSIPGTLTVTATAITNNIITATNTLAAGNIVTFSSSFNGITSATRYYVLSTNLSGSGFSVSLEQGGTAVTITTTGSVSSTGTVSSATANVITSAGCGAKLAGQDTIVFPTTVGGSSQTTFGSIVLGTTYYIVNLQTNTFSISLSAGGIPVSLTAGTGSLSGTETETAITITSNVDDLITSVDGLITKIGTRQTGLTAVKNSDGQLVIYLDGTTDRVQLAGTMATKAGILGTFLCPALQISAHTGVPEWKTGDTGKTRPTGSVWIKSTDANLGASYTVYQYNTTTNSFVSVNAPLYADNATALYNLDISAGGASLAAGVTYVKFNDSERTFWESNANLGTGTAVSRASPANATFNLYTRSAVGATTITSKIVSTTSGTTTCTFTAASPVAFQMAESVIGSATLSSAKTISFTSPAGTSADATTLAGLINAAGFVNITASVNASNQLIVNHKQGGEIRFVNTQGTPLSTLFTPGTTTNLYSAPAGDSTYTFGYASNWKAVSTLAAGLTSGATPPSTTTADGAIWYNASVNEADILVNTGLAWTGYKNVLSGTDSLGPTIGSTRPTTYQQDGTTALATGDLWIDTSDLENYPKMYRYNSSTKKWTLVDNSDQTSENGIVFADARAGTTGGTATVPPTGTIVELLTSTYVDGDAPDPALYPKGMLLWNTRRSTFNVKQFKQNYVDLTVKNYRQSSPAGVSQATYYPHRWVSIAANQPTGAGTFGRKAQRAVVTQALQALINSNQNIRDEDSVVYNLLSCPGYPETVNELISLNYDRALASFVVADAPSRLTADATSLSNWGNNTKGAVDNGDDGLVSTDPYCAFYYPWGYSSDNLGNNIVVPPSHMMLRTIALSDNVSYPWFAPAGTRRGGITNASAVGYITEQGEFQSVALNSGQRDTLAAIHVNPITFISGSGLVAYGQYTRQLAASSLDRINVARLVVYLRRQFNALAKPYVFEPNDTITRNEIKGAAESLLLELVGQRAIYDYLVVCDTSNNTPARIDRSELYLDVAIEPVKAAEFIYIPLRLENTGAIKGLGQ
jgi:hypothetical protein